MREKLIGLLNDMPFGHSTYEEEARHMEDLGDYLIANGVIVLPCKPGDSVYVIRECSCYNAPNCREHTKKCSTKVYLGTRLRTYHCGYVSEAKFKLNQLEDVGETVFMTREEAEAKLRKMGTDHVLRPTI